MCVLQEAAQQCIGERAGADYHELSAAVIAAAREHGIVLASVLPPVHGLIPVKVQNEEMPRWIRMTRKADP